MSTGKLSYKMTLLGDSGVGKTSLFKKITKENFDPKIVSTIGIDKRTLFFNINTSEGEKEVEISLYDTAGQERFKSISISYFRESKGLLVIYDITNYETFKHVGVWLGDVIDTLGKKDDYIIILWGNKVDLVNADPEQRDVDEEEAKEFCEKNNLLWGGECSAKDFSSDQFREIFKDFITKMQKKVGDNFKAEEDLLKKKKKNQNQKKGCC